MRIKIRRIEHKQRKNLGFPEDKWAKGGGSHGYARSYGHNCTCSNQRTREEHRNKIDRDELEHYEVG